MGYVNTYNNKKYAVYDYITYGSKISFIKRRQYLTIFQLYGNKWTYQTLNENTDSLL